MVNENNFTYYIRETYGTERKYPVSSDSHMICELSGKETLTDWAINIIQRYYPDVTFEEVLKPRKGAKE